MDYTEYLIIHWHFKSQKPKIIYAKLKSALGPPYRHIPRFFAGAGGLNEVRHFGRCQTM
jgi:hypothetical protein